MDYALWVKDLHHSLGKKNVCILIMENIATEKFWKDLNTFCNLENFNIQTMLFQTQKSYLRIVGNCRSMIFLKKQDNILTII